jgi:hypothetical protein
MSEQAGATPEGYTTVAPWVVTGRCRTIGAAIAPASRSDEFRLAAASTW